MPVKKSPSKIKNYRSQSDMSTIFETIRQCLATHKAKRVTFDYDDDGQATSIHFTMHLSGNFYTFRLPVHFERVEALVAESYRATGKYITGDTLKEQAYRTSWANIRDWIVAQMALIDAGVVKTEEVFFPYMLTSEGQTLFEEFEQYRALPAPGHITVTEAR